MTPLKSSGVTLKLPFCTAETMWMKHGMRQRVTLPSASRVRSLSHFKLAKSRSRQRIYKSMPPHFSTSERSLSSPGMSADSTLISFSTSAVEWSPVCKGHRRGTWEELSRKSYELGFKMIPYKDNKTSWNVCSSGQLLKQS